MKKVAFTIVLNGMPFLKQQYEIIPKVFDEWIIVEGYALPVKDTSWCRNIDMNKFTINGLSNDGTTEFLDSIACDKIKIIRKPNGQYWNGKTEMCNAAIAGLSDTILMEFDVDEIWKESVLDDILCYAEQNSDIIDGMRFKCNYYVGPNMVTVGNNCYGNNYGEWSRLWVIRIPTTFKTHEPPVLDRVEQRIVDRDTTMNWGWVFDHYAYVIEEQLKFKEDYYGYRGAVRLWKNLQKQSTFPCKLKPFLPWVDDKATVIKI